MKALARLIKFFFIFLALALVGLLAFVATFDANNYKPEIIEQVEKATGRSFTVDGDIHLSIFPWVGLSVENVALGNAKGFKAKQFAAIKQLDVKVNVLPLLKKEVQINTIRLHGLEVSLEVASDKSNNWSSFVQADEISADEAPTVEVTEKAVTEKTTAEQGKTSPLQSLQVEGFEFVDATIRYHDQSSNTQATISELNLTTSAIKFDQAVDVSFAARIESKQPEIDTKLKLTTQLIFNKAFTKFDLADFVFTLLAQKNAFIAQQEKIEIKSNIEVSMDEQRISLKQVQLSALGTNTLAEFTVSQFLETPLVEGNVEIQAFNARELAKRAGMELPAMAKADALRNVALKTKIKLQGEKLEVNDLNLTVDGSTLSGWLHVLNISKQQLRYKLAFDQLNINDYLPAVTEVVSEDVSASATKTNNNAAASKATVNAATATGDEKIELPVEMMRKLDIQGDLRITKLTAKEYKIKSFLMSLIAKKGEIVIKPLSMQVLEGQLSAALKLNVKKQSPAYAIDLNVNQLQMGPVVNPFLDGVMGDKPLKMDGTVDVKMDIKTSGDSVNQLKKASKGAIVLDMKETRVDGFDPEFYMRKSIADYVHSKGFALSKTIMGKYESHDVTVFDKIHGTLNVANGKVRTDDFLMDSKRVKVIAKGHADIMRNTLDVVSSIRLPRAKTVAEKIFDEPVFVRVYGPFDALKYELDKDKLKKSTSNALKKEAEAKLEAEKQRAKEKVRQESKKITDKFKDKLKNKLKGLF